MSPRTSPTKSKDFTLRISIESAFSLLFVAALGYAFWTIKGLLLVVLTAVVFASFIDGMTNWMRLKKIPRTPAVMSIYLLTIGAFGGIFYLFLPIFLDELSGLLALLPPDSTVMALLGAFAEGGILSNGDPGVVLSQIRELYQSVSGGFLQGTSTIFGGIINLVLILVISFYLAVQERGIEQFLRIVTPYHHEKYVIDVWRRTKKKIGLWFQGQLLLALVIGVLTYLGLLLIGIPYALLLSLLAGIFALVPFGAFIAIVPAMLISFSAGGWSMALLTAGLFVIIQQFENYLFQPLIIQRATGVPSIIVLLSLVFGVKLFGFLGLFLSIPAAVLILELLSDYEKIKLASTKMKK